MGNMFGFLFSIVVLATASSAVAACPSYTAPACTAGEGVVMGKDAAKCAMPMCQKITEKCPTYPAVTCEEAQKLGLSPDPKNKKCQMAVCR